MGFKCTYQANNSCPWYSNNILYVCIYTYGIQAYVHSIYVATWINDSPKLCICSYYYICICLQLVPYITFGNSDYTVGENDTLHVNITLSHASVFDMTVTVYATTVNATGK